MALCNPHRLYKARALPWVEVVCGELGEGDDCSSDLPLCVLICWYLSGGRRGVTRACLVGRTCLVTYAPPAPDMTLYSVCRALAGREPVAKVVDKAVYTVLLGEK